MASINTNTSTSATADEMDSDRGELRRARAHKALARSLRVHGLRCANPEDGRTAAGTVMGGAKLWPVGPTPDASRAARRAMFLALKAARSAAREAESDMRTRRDAARGTAARERCAHGAPGF